MKRGIFAKCVFCLSVITGGCGIEAEETSERKVSEKYANLIGKWKQNDSVQWIFGSDEVRWNGFSHPCVSSGDSLEIGVLVYYLKKVGPDTAVLYQNGKRIELIQDTL